MLQTSGGTEIFKGLQAGYNEISRFASPSYVSNIILITDGRTYGDDDACIQLAGIAKENNITIHGMGIGHQWNDEFMDKLANLTGGSCVFASKPQAVKNLLETKIRQISKTFAKNVTLQFNENPNVEIRYIFRLNPEASSIVIEDKIVLGDIPLGNNLSVLMEVMIHEIPQNKHYFTSSPWLTERLFVTFLSLSIIPSLIIIILFACCAVSCS